MRFDAIFLQHEITALLAKYPELAEDEVLRADTIEGMTDAHGFLRKIEAYRRDAISLAEAIKITIADLSARKSRFERRDEAMRDLIMKIMNTAHLKKLETPEATFSIRNNAPKLVGDASPETLPDNLVKIKREPDRPAIKKALEEGQAIEGYALSNQEPSLAIRTK